MRSMLVTIFLVSGCDPELPEARPIPSSAVADAMRAVPRSDATRSFDAATPELGAAARAAYPELLDLRTRFIYELVAGRSLATLAPVAGAPRVFGMLGEPWLEDGFTVGYLATGPEGGRIKRGDAATTNRTLKVVWDEDGLRQLAALLDRPGDKASLRGFTFPTTIDAPVALERDLPFGKIAIRISKQRLAIAGEARDLVVADTTIHERSPAAKSFEVFAYAPGLGPALLCSPTDRRTDLRCLRLVGTDERRCAVAARQLCAGAGADTCDAILRKLLIDPKNGKARATASAEKLCAGYLENPSEMAAIKEQLGSGR